MSDHVFSYVRLTSGEIDLPIRDVAQLARDLFPMHSVDATLTLEVVSIKLDPDLTQEDSKMLSSAVESRRLSGVPVECHSYLRSKPGSVTDLSTHLVKDLRAEMPGKEWLAFRMEGDKAMVEVHPPCTADEQMVMDKIVAAYRVSEAPSTASPTGVALVPTVEGLPTAERATGVAIVRDANGEAMLVFSDGVNWRRAHDQSILA